jgi:hypothetical protein
MASFEFDDPQQAPSRSRPQQRSAGSVWLSNFSSTLAAVIVGGVILLVGVRVYIRWSVNDTVEKIGQEHKRQDINLKRFE